MNTIFDTLSGYDDTEFTDEYEYEVRIPPSSNIFVIIYETIFCYK
jgi:hypothetical protein